MEARETTFERLIQGDNQFQIPLYQRTYSWDADDHQRLWDDLVEQATAGQDASQAFSGHFLGSLVLDPRPPLPDTVQRWVVIDGQQRLTTLMLLACALRDHVAVFDPAKARLIHRRYLVNEEDYGGLDAYRLLPTQADRPAYLACVDNDPRKGGEDSIGVAYRFFRKALATYDPASEWDTVRHIDQALRHRLTLVTIAAGPQDNAFRIFESLNNTGKPLSQADLLRNYVFMQLPRLGEHVYDTIWLPLQTELGPERLTTLAWLDLVLQGNSRASVTEVYQEQQRRMGKIVKASEEEGLRDDLIRLRRLGHLLMWVFEPEQEPDSGLRAVLRRLGEWGGEAHYPPALHVLDRVDQGTADTEQAVEALTYVESFLVRRMICREPSNSVRRILADLPSRMEQDLPLPEAVRRHLSRGRRGDWPRDEEFREAIRTQPFYWQGSSRHRAYVLRRFEEDYMSPEPVDFSRAWATIEHILPQRPGKEWLAMLAEDAEDGQRPEDLHEELVHTLGNLTLTGENTRLSNHPYERKQQIFDRSALRMNREIADAGRWGRIEVLRRADGLADRAVRMWPGPVAGDGGESGERSEWLRLRQVLASLPSGRWTTYRDLGAVTGAGSPQTVGSYLASRTDVINAHRVLHADGTSSPEFSWLDGRTESQQDVLEREGVRFNGAVADREQKLTVGELADFAGLDRPHESDGDQWAAAEPEGLIVDRPGNFRTLLRTHHPDLADGLLTLLGKWEADGGWCQYGAAEETSCAPALREGNGPQGAVWPVTVYPRAGVVEVVFAHLARREPFTRLGLLVELRDRLRTVPGVTLTTPEAELPRRRPNFPLAVLRGDGLIRFAETLEWFRGQSL